MAQVADAQGSTSGAAALVDSAGTVVAWSDEARRLLGHTPTDVVARPIGDVLYEPVPEPARKGWAPRAASAAPVRCRHADGSLLELLVSTQPLSGIGGGTVWLLTIDAPRSVVGHTPLPEVTGGSADDYWTRCRVRIMNEASVRIGTTLELGRTAEELAEVARESFADFVTVDLLEDVLRDERTDVPPEGSATLRRVALQSVLEGCPEAVLALGETHQYNPGSPLEQTLATGKGMRLQLDEDADSKWSSDIPERINKGRAFGVHSVMVVPLQARGITLGVTTFCRHKTPEPFGDDDLLMAEDLVARAAVCVDNARRYARERTTALTLQRSLLPQSTPAQSAVDVAYRYLPAGSRAGIGGDWYDVIPLSGARVALVVGDVVGHGLHASATMGRLRTAVRTLADVDLQVDELLTHLDDVVLRLEREAGGLEDSSGRVGGISASCLYAIYDPTDRRCVLSSAGHLPPALVTPDRAVSYVDMPIGPPLGVGGLPFETAEFEVPEGSVLALFTDGLVESGDRDVSTGLSRLRHLLRNAPFSLEGTCDLLVETLLPQHRTDDVALLLARTRGLGKDCVATWDLPADPAVVADARRLVAGQLADWGLEEALFTTELVVSELVTNAIRYGSEPIRLRLINDTALTCEVADGSSTSPHLRRARDFDEGGRGLMLVAQLTDRWGTRHTGQGKIIWAAQDLPGLTVAELGPKVYESLY